MTKKKKTGKSQKSNLKNHKPSCTKVTEGNQTRGKGVAKILELVLCLFNFFKSLFIGIKGAFIK
jgi:hypothetical protein